MEVFSILKLFLIVSAVVLFICIVLFNLGLALHDTICKNRKKKKTKYPFKS